MDEDEDGFQFAPGKRQNAAQRFGVLKGFVIGIILIPAGVALGIILALGHQSPLFGILAVVAGILLIIFSRDTGRRGWGPKGKP